jgi:hypothetical protein
MGAACFSFNKLQELLHIKIIRIQNLVLTLGFPFKILIYKQYLMRFTTILLKRLMKLLNAWFLGIQQNIFTYLFNAALKLDFKDNDRFLSPYIYIINYTCSIFEVKEKT